MRYLATILLLFITSAALADTPVGPMNYQGRLLDANGIPLTGSYDFVVRVYDAASGGTLKYQETHSGVAVDDGVYTFLVGTAPKDAGDSTWSVELWNCCGALYMELSANGQALLPRSRLAAAPYAYQANLALTTNNALALGGKSAAEYDNALATICETSKGKWLDLVGKCLGIGASFPGPSLTPWNQLSSDNNYTNLDLSRANISGIDFQGADMTGTLFFKTVYAVQGMANVILKDTRWESAIATDAGAEKVNGTLEGAYMKNMDLSLWNMVNIENPASKGYSAAEISGCPVSPPVGWECRPDGLGGSNNFLLGPGANLSYTSAAAESRFGASYLNLGLTVLDGANLAGATFEGITITQELVGVNLDQANLNYTKMRSTFIAGSHFANTTFIGSVLDKPFISSGETSYFSDVDFTNAEISYARFLKDVDHANFTNATLHNVYFIGTNHADFSKAVLDEVNIANAGDGCVFSETRFYHGFNFGAFYSGSATSAVFNNVTFVGGVLSGGFSGATFTGYAVFEDVTSSTSLNICAATFPLDANGTVPGWNIITGALCPDGSQYGPCNMSPHMNPVSLGSCPGP